MATSNAPYYSCKAGKQVKLKSHRKWSSALKAAGEMGQVWDTERQRQRQVHAAAGGGWLTTEPDPFFATDLMQRLRDAELLAPEDT